MTVTKRALLVLAGLSAFGAGALAEEAVPSGEFIKMVWDCTATCSDTNNLSYEYRTCATSEVDAKNDGQKVCDEGKLGQKTTALCSTKHEPCPN